MGTKGVDKYAIRKHVVVREQMLQLSTVPSIGTQSYMKSATDKC